MNALKAVVEYVGIVYTRNSSKVNDNFDVCGLKEAQMEFANAFDISLRGQIS